jgi:hypothetical protein
MQRNKAAQNGENPCWQAAPSPLLAAAIRDTAGRNMRDNLEIALLHFPKYFRLWSVFPDLCQGCNKHIWQV